MAEEITPEQVIAEHGWNPTEECPNVRIPYDVVLNIMRDYENKITAKSHNVAEQHCGHRSIMYINSEIGWLCFDCRKFSLDKQTFR